MRTQEELYRFHCENLRQVYCGMERVALTLRRAISISDKTTVDALVRLYALLLGTWAECRLKKLLYEKSGFSDAEREKIKSIGDQFGRWEATVETAFRKRYGISNAAINASTIPFTAAARFKECRLLVSDDLRPVIELRNKFAHGQWAYLLTNDETDVSTLQMGVFRKENLMTLQFKHDLLNHLASLINDLVVSAAFDRDFDTHYRLIVHTRARLANQSYADYVARLVQRHERGKAARRT